jgi:short-subunit dehydrogenase
MAHPNESLGGHRPLAAVTGASSGIGRDLADRLAARGYDLVLIARREELLIQLAAALHETHGVTCEPFAADLRDYDDRERAARRLERDRDRLDVLVNNAGFGTHGFFHETDLERELDLIEVNCAAPVHLTKRVLPAMLARSRGHVLNVSSTSGFAPGPVMALYYASKGFLLSFSEALWEECRGTGVTVTALCPGPVRTDFQRVAGIAATARSSGTTPIPSTRVAEEAITGMMQGRRVVIPGRQNRWAAFLARHLPRARVLRTVRRIQEERRRQTLEARRT